MTDISIEWIELKVSNDALDDVEELRRRIDEDGYLFFRQLQDPGKLLALRREMLSVMQQGPASSSPITSSINRIGGEP